MFFTWEEIVVWIGVTLFEAWIHTVCITVFLLFMTLKLDGILVRSWWVIFSPLFVGNALSAYFCVIGFIRMYLEGLHKHAVIRTIWSLSFLLLMTIFEVLLIRKLMGYNNLEYSEILSPIFILLQLVTARTCRLYGSSWLYVFLSLFSFFLNLVITCVALRNWGSLMADTINIYVRICEREVKRRLILIFTLTFVFICDFFFFLVVFCVMLFLNKCLNV